MRRIFPAAALLALTLCACGSREVVLSASGDIASSGRSSAPLAPPTSSGEAPTRGEVDAAIGTLREDAGASKEGERAASRSVDYGDDFGPAAHNTMPLKVRLSATCARPGDTMRATAETLPGSKLAFAASYSDNDFIPNFTYVPGETNATGTFTWAWEITPTTPRGDALLTVVASKGQKGASFKEPFRVADSC